MSNFFGQRIGRLCAFKSSQDSQSRKIKTPRAPPIRTALCDFWTVLSFGTYIELLMSWSWMILSLGPSIRSEACLSRAARLTREAASTKRAMSRSRFATRPASRVYFFRSNLKLRHYQHLPNKGSWAKVDVGGTREFRQAPRRCRNDNPGPRAMHDAGWPPDPRSCRKPGPRPLLWPRRGWRSHHFATAHAGRNGSRDRPSIQYHAI